MVDPRDRLKDARAAAAQGRYADALRDHIWFHEHALEHMPSLAGVRLSFALSDWVELGREYPEALRSLEDIRESKVASLVAGPRHRDVFHDVVAINRELGSPALSYELFRRLCEVDEGFARSCADIAIECVVAVQDFGLAARFLTEPRARVDARCGLLNDDVRRLRAPDRAMRRLEQKLAAHASVYAEDVALVLAVLEGVGRSAEAGAIRDRAIEAVEDESVRANVREILSRSPRAG